MTQVVSRPWALLGGVMILALSNPAPAEAFGGHRRTVVSTGYALPSVPAVVAVSPAPVVVARPLFGGAGVVVPPPAAAATVATPLPQALPPASPAVTTYYAPPSTFAAPGSVPLATSAPPATVAPPLVAAPTAFAPTVAAPAVAPATALPAVAAPRPTIVVPGSGLMLRRPILVVP